MHDFCMTLPYGALVALGGLAGFLSKGTATASNCHIALSSDNPCANRQRAVAHRRRWQRRAADAAGLAQLEGLEKRQERRLRAIHRHLCWCALYAPPARCACAHLPSAVLAAALTAMMGKKFLLTRAVFPPGVVAALSASMLLFYVYNLASGGNPPQSKVAD